MPLNEEMTLYSFRRRPTREEDRGHDIRRFMDSVMKKGPDGVTRSTVVVYIYRGGPTVKECDALFDLMESNDTADRATENARKVREAKELLEGKGYEVQRRVKFSGSRTQSEPK